MSADRAFWESRLSKRDDGKLMARITAVRFRSKVYAAGPRHKDAIDKAFEGMSQHTLHRVCGRISDGKESIEFGMANEDGTGWERDIESHDARMEMYGFR